jgi:hypothetical protein
VPGFGQAKLGLSQLAVIGVNEGDKPFDPPH